MWTSYNPLCFEYIVGLMCIHKLIVEGDPEYGECWQARLIDDVTGTLPPYDQFITLGPVSGYQTLSELYNIVAYGFNSALSASLLRWETTFGFRCECKIQWMR